jgi:hypothetical protein
MTTSSIVHRDPAGDRLLAVLSLAMLRSLDAARIAGLHAAGIKTVSDLLHYQPVHRARLIAAVARGQVAHDVDLRILLRDGAVPTDAATLLTASTELVDGIGPPTAIMFAERFGVTTIAELAELAPFAEAEALLRHEAEPFSEPASAPDELMPRAFGLVASTARFNSVVIDQTHRYAMRIDAPGARDKDLADVFTTSGTPATTTIDFGYVALQVQTWTHLGTGLGEVRQSLALAPGESRNLAIIDWRRRHLFSRDESTSAHEVLDTAMLHGRALDDVVQATAREHQWGRTFATAATATLGAGLVVGGGMAAGAAIGAGVGGLSGQVVGAVAGAVIGAEVAGPIGALAGGATGMGVGGMVGSAAGLVGGAVIGGIAGSVGYIQSDTRGDREIVAQDRQNILDVTSQKSSYARSLRSTIVIDDAQRERAEARTQNVTNYNHAHALNLTYHEILDRYLVQIRTERLEPFVVLPFRAMDFDDKSIADYWDLIGPGVADRALAARFGALVTGSGALDLPAAPIDGGDQLIALELEIERELTSPAPDEVVLKKADGNTMALRLSTNAGAPAVGFVLDRVRAEAPWTVALRDVREIQVKFEERFRTTGGRYRVTVGAGEIKLASGEHRRVERKDLGRLAMTAGRAAVALGYNWDPLGDVQAGQRDAASAGDDVARVRRYVQRRSHYFTRLILASIEAEDLLATLGGLAFLINGQHYPVVDYVDPLPIGYTARGLMFRVKAVDSAPLLLQGMVNFPAELDAWFKIARGQVTSRELCLPAQGLFCEAVLGRANSAEKIDLTRFWNWQDSPIPNPAPAIDPTSTGSRAEPLPGVTPTVPSNVITIGTPTVLPDATGLAGVLAAIQNPNIFRDMSKADLLAGTMNHLATVAEHAATAAGTLAGEAGQRAMAAAIEMGKAAAALAEKIAEDPTGGAGTGSGGGTGGQETGSGSGGSSDEVFEAPRLLDLASNPTIVGGAINENQKPKPRPAPTGPRSRSIELAVTSVLAPGADAGDLPLDGFIDLGFGEAGAPGQNPTEQVTTLELASGVAATHVTLREDALYTIRPRLALGASGERLIGGLEFGIDGLDVGDLAATLATKLNADLRERALGVTTRLARGQTSLALKLEGRVTRREQSSIVLAADGSLGVKAETTGSISFDSAKIETFVNALVAALTELEGAGTLLTTVRLAAGTTATATSAGTASAAVTLTLLPSYVSSLRLSVDK